MGFRFRPNLKGHPEIKRILKFMGASLVGIGVVQFNLLVETQLASTYETEDGSDGPVSWLIYGFRLVQLPQTIVAGSVAVAALAALSLHLSRGEKIEARQTLARSLELNSLLILPAAVGLYLLADPLIALFFEGNEFTARDTAATAGILRMYAASQQSEFVHIAYCYPCFCTQRSLFTMKLSIVVMVTKLPVAWGMMYPMGLGLNGLPLSHAVTVTFEVGIMLWVLGGRMGGWSPGFWNQQARIVVASIGMGACVWMLKPYSHGFGVLLVCAAGAGVYVFYPSFWGFASPKQYFASTSPGPASTSRRSPPGAPKRPPTTTSGPSMKNLRQRFRAWRGLKHPRIVQVDGHRISPLGVRHPVSKRPSLRRISSAPDWTRRNRTRPWMRQWRSGRAGSTFWCDGHGHRRRSQGLRSRSKKRHYPRT